MLTSTLARPLAEGFLYPEGPRWRDGWLWFSDQHDGHVRAMTPGGLITLALEIPGRPSGLGWLPNGDLLVVSMALRCLYRWDGEQLSLHAELGALHPGESNDMVVADDGTAYVGNVGFDFHAGETPRATCLAGVEPGGGTWLAAEGLLCPNGSVITDDGRLIVAESLAHRLTQFDINACGRLSNPRLFAALGDHVPDGICLDAENAVWFASPFANAVIRVHEGGAITEQVEVDGAHPYACMLGGNDRRTLFICCAPDHDPARTRQLRGGRIDSVQVEIPGAGLP